MSPTAQRILAQALAAVPDLPRDGWDHFLTAMDVAGYGAFSYDHPDGSMIRVTVRPALPCGVSVGVKS